LLASYIIIFKDCFEQSVEYGQIGTALCQGFAHFN